MLVEMFAGKFSSSGGTLQYLWTEIRFIYMDKISICSFAPKKHQLLAFTDPYRSNLHPSLCDVLYRTDALKVLG